MKHPPRSPGPRKPKRPKQDFGKSRPSHEPKPASSLEHGMRPSGAERAPADAGARQGLAARAEPAPAARPALARPAGPRPTEQLPLILEVEPGDDYALLDSGDGEKLERYGPLTVRRPENQAIWPRRLTEREWERVDAVFTGDTDEEGTGRWRFPGGPLGETWPLSHRRLDFLGRFTSYRHVGVFPEQAAHWDFVSSRIETARRPVRLLNLFGYTGIASLLAARDGAEVTHVDASKKAIGWARENQELAGLAGRPVRWICEDAVRYVEREVRRGSRYEAILLDPPRFGRGPRGEVWQIFEDLPYLLSLCRELLSERPLLMILTAYSIRSSFYSLSALMGESLRGMGGLVQSGELVIREAGDEPRILSTSLFSRWIPSDE